MEDELLCSALDHSACNKPALAISSLVDMPSLTRLYN